MIRAKVSDMLGNSYLRGISYSFLANLSNSLSQWLIFSFIAKKFGTEALGSYSLAIAWILPLFAFFSLQLRNMHVSDQKNEFSFDLFFSLRVICSILFVVLVYLIGVCMYNGNALIFLFLGLARGFELISDIIHAEFHRRKKIVLYSKRLLVRSFFTVVFAFISFHFIPNFKIAIVSIPLAYLVNLIIDFFFLKKEIDTFSFSIQDKQGLKTLLLTGILVGVSLLFVYLLPSIPRFILEKFRNSYELGLFSGYMYLIILARIFVQALTQNSLPHLASYFSAGNLTAFKKSVKKEILFLTLIGILQFIILPLSNFIFPLLYNHDFVGNKGLLIIIFTGSLFSFIAFSLNNALNAMQMFKIQLPVYGTLVVISFLLAYLLIPKYGMIGAGLVFMMAAIIQSCFLFLVFMNKLKKEQIKLSI